MGELLSPFSMRPIACPICKSEHAHRMFRVRLFVPKDIESDQHVLTYRWQAENTEVIHPPYFALFYCPKCYFTDLADDYRDPSRCKNTYFIVKTFGSFNPETDRLVEFMGRYVNYASIDYNVALTLHYLALFIQISIPADVQDLFKLSRLALRIAWLYREEKTGLHIPSGPRTCKGKAYFDFPSYDGFREELKKHWPAMPVSEEEATRLSCTYMERAVATDSRFDQPAKYYQGVKLLLCLLDRCGDLEGAYNTVRGIYAQGAQSRSEFQKTLAKPETSEHVRQQIAADMRVVNAYMADAGALRDDLLDRMVERDLPTVHSLVRANATLPPKEIEKLVLKAGVIPDVFRRIQSKTTFNK